MLAPSDRGPAGLAAAVVLSLVAGTATAQGRPSAEDLIRTVKGAKLYDLSFTWNEQSPVLGQRAHDLAGQGAHG